MRILPLPTWLLAVLTLGGAVLIAVSLLTISSWSNAIGFAGLFVAMNSSIRLAKRFGASDQRQ